MTLKNFSKPTCCISLSLSPPSSTPPSKTGRRRRTINMMSIGILASGCFFANPSSIVPSTEAFTTPPPLPFVSKTCSRSTALSSISSTSLQPQSKQQPQPPSRRRKKEKKQTSKKIDKQKQSNLFQTFAKYKAIQDQLSSLNLVPVPIDEKKNNNINNNSKYSHLHNNTKRREEVELQLLEEQAKALRISKSTLSYIQLRGQKAREELLLMNMGLVHSTVNRILYKHRQKHRSNNSSTSNNNSRLLLKSINKDDLVQEGMIGLTYAIDKFDTTRKVAFSTYATYWIEGRILRYMKMKLYFIHVPEYMQNIVLKLEKKVHELDSLFMPSSSSSLSSPSSSYGDDDVFTRIEEMVLQDRSKMKILCRELGYDSKTVLRAFQVRRTMYNSKSNSMVELEDWMKMRNSAGSSSSISSDSNSNMSSLSSTSDDSDGQQVLERYQNILGQFISIREMEALSWRYGLLKQHEQEEEQQQRCQKTELQQVPRDYEAEAEDDLFGPQGILTTSSTSRSSASATPPKTMVASIRTSAFTNKTIQQQQPITKGGRWGEAMSFSEVGEQMRVSAEYGRRLCASALKKLTKAVEEGDLDPAMLF